MKKVISGIITEYTQSYNKVYISSDIAKGLKLNEQLTIRYGQERVTAQVVIVRGSQTIRLSSNLWRELSIPFTHRVHFALEENQLKIGPLVGIFTTLIYPSLENPAGKRTNFFKRYLYSQKDLPASYFIFGPKDISFNQKRVQGYFLRMVNGRIIWEKHTIPLPDVIYNRVFRVGEKFPSVIEAKRRLQEAGCKMFNPFCFNKWDIYQRIKYDPGAAPYLPETILHPSYDELSTLLKKYKMIYLKPVEGYMGFGIVKMYYRPDGIYCRYNKKGKNQLIRYSTLEGAIKHIFGKRNLKDYIAQQGIQLIRLDDRSIDLRVHTNRDHLGKWKVTAVAAKMAGKGSVTTHIRTGGKVFSFDEILSRLFTEKERSVVKQKLEDAAISLSKSISDKLPKYVGDIGFDIGIDQNGHPWLFEANSQPGRHVFAHPSLRAQEPLSRRMILDFALYLSQFTNHKKELII